MDNKKSSIILLLILVIVIITCIVGFEEVIALGIAMFIPIAIVGGAIMYAQKNNKKIEDIQKIETEIESLQQIYDEICNMQKAELRKLSNKMLLYTIVIITLTIVSLIVLYYSKFIFLPIFIAFIVEILLLCSNYNQKNKYYEKIINDFIETTNSSERNLKYIFSDDKNLFSETERMVNEEYRYYKENDRWKWISNDYLYGSILNIPVKISYGREHYKSKSYRSKGGLLELTMIGKTFVTIDIKTTEKLKMIFDDTNQNEEELLHIDNEWISNYYKCYSTNKESAHRFFTLDFIEFIKSYIEKYKIDIEIIFKDNVCIMFHTKDMFSRERIGDICGDKVTMSQHYVVMKFITELIERLN